MGRASPSLDSFDDAVMHIHFLASGDLRKSLHTWRRSRMEGWLEWKAILDEGDVVYLPKDTNIVTTR